MAVCSGAAYAVAAWLSYRLAFALAGIVLVWLPAGLLLGALLLLDRRLWPFAIGGAFFGNIGVDLALVGLHWWALAGAGVNMLESYLSARLLQRFVRPRVTFDALWDVLGFLGLGLGLANALAAIPGA